MLPVILSGGSGTRLWPLSRQQQPKQLLPLITERSLFQDTISRLESLQTECLAPIVVCNRAHGPLISGQLREIGCQDAQLIYEPEGRNTAPAAAVAALLAGELYPDSDSTLLILPADHAIGQLDAFANAVAVARAATDDDQLVTFGVSPDRPETGYGYIKRGAQSGDLFEVEQFVEKPSLELARAYLKEGDYYWNSGMFMFKARTYLAELESFSPEIVSACRRSFAGAIRKQQITELESEAFLACPSDSIDYAVMEHTVGAAVTPLDADWSDVGNWASLHDICDQDADGNIEIGNTLSLDCRRSYLRAGDRVVVAVGVDDLIVVDTPDAVLVIPKDQAQRVKEVVEMLDEQGRSDLLSTMSLSDFSTRK